MRFNGNPWDSETFHRTPYDTRIPQGIPGDAIGSHEII